MMKMFNKKYNPIIYLSVLFVFTIIINLFLHINHPDDLESKSAVISTSNNEEEAKIEKSIITRISTSTTNVENINEMIKEKEVPEVDMSLERIFNGLIDDYREDDSDAWVLAVTGDVMLGRTVNTQTIKYKDYNWGFAGISDILEESDISFINLESPLIKNCDPTDTGMIFCGSLNHVEGISNAGIDVVGVANNHALNKGIKGLDETVRGLEDKGILVPGYDNPKYYDLNDMKIAFLAFDDVECYEGIECTEEGNIISDLKTARSNADLVIVMYHWGSEYTYNPTTRQLELAYLSIDEGADLVLGNHPHWYQPVEVYKGKVIMYSHGNAIFDQMWSEETRTGIIGKYYFKGKALVDVNFTPLYIHDYGRAEIINGSKSEIVLNNLKEISLSR